MKLSKLKIIRMEKGLTQQQLAEASGASRQTIYNIEKQNWMPKLDLAQRIAQALETPIEDLFSDLGKD